MKRKLQIILSASAASVLAFSAVAQDAPIPKTVQPNYTGDRMPDARAPARLNEAVKATDFIGMTVKNNQDEKLGKVQDLAVDVESGRIVQVILATGGFIGFGETLTAVPPGALHHDVAQKVLHLDADKEKLKSAPKFESSNWAECCDSNHLSAVYSYYGQEPSFTFINGGYANLDGQPKPGSKRKMDATKDQISSSTEKQCMIPMSRLSQLQKASKLIGTPVKNLQDEKLGRVENILMDLPSGRVVAVILSSGGFLGLGDELSAVPPTAFQFTAERDNLQLDATKETLGNRPHFKANQWADLSEPTYTSGIYRAYGVQPYFTSDDSQATDNTARNVSDRIDRTHTPLNQGNSQAAVDPASPVEPYANVNQAPDNTKREIRDRIESTDATTQADVERTSRTERYSNIGYSSTNVNQAPDNAKRYVRDRIESTDATSPADVERAAAVDSTSTTNATAPPDNTARNVRDRNSQTLTPLDQGNSQADVDTTAQIRKEIIAGKDMSVNAKNVKVITNKGQVTLRGPVNTAAEKLFIGEIANRIARSENVDNQLEVKLTTTTSSNPE